jgi:hypothetical protein
MKKLSLNLEQLSVESFETAEGEKRTGTVRAYICSDVCTASCQPTCGNVPISYDSGCEFGALAASRLNCGDTEDFRCCV